MQRLQTYKGCHICQDVHLLFVGLGAALLITVAMSCLGKHLDKLYGEAVSYFIEGLRTARTAAMLISDEDFADAVSARLALGHFLLQTATIFLPQILMMLGIMNRILETVLLLVLPPLLVIALPFFHALAHRVAEMSGNVSLYKTYLIATQLPTAGLAAVLMYVGTAVC